MEVICLNIPEAFRRTWTLRSSEYEPIDEERPPVITKTWMVIIAVTLAVIIAGWVLLMVGYETIGTAIMISVPAGCCISWVFMCLYRNGYFDFLGRICCCFRRPNEMETPETPPILEPQSLPPTILVPQTTSCSIPTQRHSLPSTREHPSLSTLPHSMPPSVSFLLPESEPQSHSLQKPTSANQSLAESVSLHDPDPSPLLQSQRDPSSPRQSQRNPSCQFNWHLVSSSVLQKHRDPSPLLRSQRAPSCEHQWDQVPSSLLRSRREPSPPRQSQRDLSCQFLCHPVPSSLVGSRQQPSPVPRMLPEPTPVPRSTSPSHSSPDSESLSLTWFESASESLMNSTSPTFSLPETVPTTQTFPDPTSHSF